IYPSHIPPSRLPLLHLKEPPYSS
ncbi:unnamed protein product, partial [Allacma fusca]